MSDVVVVPAPITIQAEISAADPNVCKFTVSVTVHPGGPFFFKSGEQAAGSPLVERLFALAGVAYVLVADNVVTVGKEESVSWDGLRAEIGAIIRTQLRTGVRAILESRLSSPAENRDDTELREVVQQLLDREINPSIAAHGGKISLVEVDDRRLYIEMSGGCQGCASSRVTLRQGFEVMVRRVAPEIVEIIDSTDHAAGASPFYSQADA